MSSDTLVADASGLSPRAHIALLTLQVRAAIREAEDAELAEEQWDAEAATAHLRSRLQPLVDERRAALADDLDQARTAALARIESVREVLEASPRSVVPDLLPETQAADATVVPDAEVPDVDVPDAESPDVVAVSEHVVADVDRVPDIDGGPDVELSGVELSELVAPDVELPAVEVSDVVAVSAAGVEVAADLPAVVCSPPVRVHGPGGATWSAPTRSETPTAWHVPRADQQAFAPPAVERPVATTAWARPSTPAMPLTADDVRAIVAELLAETTARQNAPLPVAMDPEAFSRAFAAAFGAALGAALDERLGGLPYGAPFGSARFTPPVPKRSFWTNMWHADVMMSLLAAVIVLVVLIAWST